MSLFLLPACAHQATISQSVDRDSLKISVQDRAQILERQSRRVRISGTGNISWVGRGENIAAAAVLLAEWPDKLRLEVQDPLGSILGLFILNGDRFWWESRKDQRAYTGASNSNRLGKILPFPVPPKVFVQAVLGRPNPDTCIAWNSGMREYSEWLWTKDTHIFLEDYAVHFGEQFPESVRVIHSPSSSDLAKLSWQWQEWRPVLPKREKIFQIPDDVSSPGLKIEKVF